MQKMSTHKNTSPSHSMAVEPPFFEKYKAMFESSAGKEKQLSIDEAVLINEELELPRIDLNQLNQGPRERRRCIEQMAEAATEFGFFQVVNHGIPEELLARLKLEQIKVFKQPFDMKASDNFLNLPARSYRWGNPMATSLRNLSWSEALHISLGDVWRMDEWKLRSTIEEYAKEANALAQTLAECLAENLGIKTSYFQDKCSASSSSLRMNRYPPCPYYSSKMFGIVPHTDTDFLTIVSQDKVGGLQLKRDGRWLCVKPNSKALVINIGDFFQALSNGIYKSITHRVVANEEEERYSAAYFYCPTMDTVIYSCTTNSNKPALYRSFSFKEYREQIANDVKATGDKVGLSRFLL